MNTSRRDFLIGLAASAPLASCLAVQAYAVAPGGAAGELLEASRVIVGREDLDPEIAQRVYDALLNRMDDFAAKVAALNSRLAAGLDRDAALAALDGQDLDLALAIAQPWYTGVVGVGDGTSDEDDAVFVTFLGAEAGRALRHILPIQSYATGAPGWWAEPPTGVRAPAMPATVRDWSYVPEGADAPTHKADPEFLELVFPQETGDQEEG
ncbi:MAG: sugar dehydrogenase complex small subunit [Parahaliea sp.]